jgi:protein-disulfide isomerase
MRNLSVFSRLALATAVVLGFAAPSLAAAAKPTPKPVAAAVMPEAMSLGSPKAKVQVVEYASPTCPHCAHFNADVFPAFKAKYVDTGKVRYTLKEFITPPNDLAGAAWVLARCGGPSHYFGIIDGVWRSQTKWVRGADIAAIFLDVAKANGLTETQFKACLNDQAAYDAVNARVTKNQADGVDSTPTFIINGKKTEGVMTLAALDAAIAAAAK